MCMGCSGAALQCYHKAAEVAAYVLDDELLVKEGDEGIAMYFLLDGEVEFESRGTRLRRTSADARVFGGSVLLGVERRYLKIVRALGTCVVLALDRCQLRGAPLPDLCGGRCQSSRLLF